MEKLSPYFQKDISHPDLNASKKEDPKEKQYLEDSKKLIGTEKNDLENNSKQFSNQNGNQFQKATQDLQERNEMTDETLLIQKSERVLNLPENDQIKIIHQRSDHQITDPAINEHCKNGQLSGNNVSSLKHTKQIEFGPNETNESMKLRILDGMDKFLDSLNYGPTGPINFQKTNISVQFLNNPIGVKYISEVADREDQRDSNEKDRLRLLELRRKRQRLTRELNALENSYCQRALIWLRPLIGKRSDTDYSSSDSES